MSVNIINQLGLGLRVPCGIPNPINQSYCTSRLPKLAGNPFLRVSAHTFHNK